MKLAQSPGQFGAVSQWVRRFGMMVTAKQLGDGNAESEATETNGHEGYQIDTAFDPREWAFGARGVGPAWAERVDYFDLFAAAAQGRADSMADTWGARRRRSA
jgi:hypothetical protein